MGYASGMPDDISIPTLAMAAMRNTDEQSATATAAPRDRALLVEMSGGDAGHVHRLVEVITTIGRGTGCTLSFADATLSREHARIARIGDGFAIEDAGSLNGTWVNQERAQRRVLAHGDRIRLGSGVRFQFHLVTAEEEAILVKLYEASVRDGLTGLFNRRHLVERLDAETAYAVRHGTGLCVVMMDLDHFKRVNDTYGHLAGDEVLRQASGVLQAQVRRADLVARYGGEEFVVIARGIPLASCRLLAERLRTWIEALEIHFEAALIRPTASLGLAGLDDCGKDKTPARLLACADEALYRAKEGGAEPRRRFRGRGVGGGTPPGLPRRGRRLAYRGADAAATRRRAASPVFRGSTRALSTAALSARRLPTSTTSLRPRVIAVYRRLRLSITQCCVCRATTTAGNSLPWALWTVMA